MDLILQTGDTRQTWIHTVAQSVTMSFDSGYDPFSIHVTLLTKTDRAILVKDEYDNKVWIPISQIDSDSEISENSKKDEQGDLIVPEWLAEQRGWL